MTHPYGGDPHQYGYGYPPPPGHQPALPPVPHGYAQAGLPAPYGYGPPVVARPPRSAGAAIALEIILGLLGVFGVGNLYAGRVGLGIALMVSFWVLFWINFVLTFVLVGWVTYPLTWIAYLVIGSITAARGVERHNSGY